DLQPPRGAPGVHPRHRTSEDGENGQNGDGRRMTASSLPVSHGTTQRKTAPVPRVPIWVVGGLVLAALALGLAAFTNDTAVLLGAAVIVLMLVAVLVPYHTPVVWRFIS